MSARRRRARHPLDRLQAALGLWWRAVRHVLTGGRTTRTRALRRAAAPPARCPTCRQDVPHSADPHDHYTL